MYLFVDKKNLTSQINVETRSETNAMLIGRKPVMNSVLACITSFHGGTKEVSVKARGESISRAIDVVEVIRRRFLPDVKVSRIGIGTDQLSAQEENQSSNVSAIEITLRR